MQFARGLRRVALAIGISTTLATVAVAQGTTGVAGVNNYTLGGMIPGSSSCTLLSPFPSGPTVFNVSTAPGAPVVFMFNINCPCRACLLPWLPAAAGCGLPPLACGIVGNQAYELDTTSGGCIFLSAGVSANTAGNATITIVLPAFIRFSTQTVGLHPCDSSNLIFSQAYNVSTV